MGEVASWYAAKFGVKISTSAGTYVEALEDGGSASGVRLKFLSSTQLGGDAVGTAGDPDWKSPKPDSSPLSDMGEFDAEDIAEPALLSDSMDSSLILVWSLTAL
jgi:hypothetical protein